MKYKQSTNKQIYQGDNYNIVNWRIQMSKPQRFPRDKVGAFIYSQPPTTQPTRYELVKYATWRMRLYQQLQSLSFEQLKNKMTNKSADQIFPKLCQTAQEKQFYMDIFQHMTQTFSEDLISYFTCLMLYSRDLKNNDFFIKMEKNILSIKLNKMTQNPSTMNIIKNLISSLLNIPVHELTISRNQFQQFQSRILWQEKSVQKILNQTTHMKIPFEHAQAGIKKRKSYIHKGYVYANIQASIDVLENLYFNYLKERVLKVRVQTQKLLENDIENQLKPFMDKAISSISTATIQQSELNSEFQLNIKNIQAVQKNYFPPCMLNLNNKLKQNKHLKHQGRRQLWLFFKGCGMNLQDNKQYFYKYLSTSVSNSQLKAHMYNIEHAYGLVGKKQIQRPKICRTIITAPDPKKMNTTDVPSSIGTRNIQLSSLNKIILQINSSCKKLQQKNKKYFPGCMWKTFLIKLQAFKWKFTSANYSLIGQKSSSIFPCWYVGYSVDQQQDSQTYENKTCPELKNGIVILIDLFIICYYLPFLNFLYISLGLNANFNRIRFFQNIVSNNLKYHLQRLFQFKKSKVNSINQNNFLYEKYDINKPLIISDILI